ncbi:MAG: hypothetical protein Unbinned5930contig1000_37 [Prokaryotic dsDNA virus sp.]|nr:MAG: hypothetical protein Unbinned5930contig1000_37 [Prokaryotic dsDNA virus sp.]|tara:strand:+ start:1825 stop:3297 length:1473 start_codon:yes stop_codon:yes gene_type:complete
MAFYVAAQPSGNSFNTTQYPIYYNVYNNNAGVLYVVGYCQYYDVNTSTWTNIGGGIRLQREIGTPNTFVLFAQKIFMDKVSINIGEGFLGVNYQPKFTQDRIGESRYKADGTIRDNYGVLKVRVRFKEEILNSDGFIEETSTTVTSNSIYCFEMGGKAKELFATWSNAGATDYHVSQLNVGNPNSTEPLTLCPEPIPTSHSSNNYLAWVVNNIDSSGGTVTNFQILLTTYVGATIVGVHWVEVDVSKVEWYMMACGLQDWEQGIMNSDPAIQGSGFYAGESLSGIAGTDMSAVETYSVMLVGGGFWGMWFLGGVVLWTKWFEVIDAPNNFSLQPQCGLDNDTANVPELVFHFKNMVGGFDRYQMLGGKYKISAVTKGEKWEKYYPFDYWWGTAVGGTQASQRQLYDKYSCTTYKMNQSDAIWFREFLSSPEVYMEIQVGGEMFNSDINQTYWQQVYINPDSIEFIDTDEDLLEISFSFIISKDDFTVSKT